MAPAVEQAHIVWRSLEFEVETSAYDRAMNLVFDGLNSLFSFGRSTRELAAEKTNQQLNGSKSQAMTINNSSSSSSSNNNNNNDKRIVFKQLSGYIKSGEITAILGPSGAGKTSLLNALCGGKLQNYRGHIELHKTQQNQQQHNAHNAHNNNNNNNNNNKERMRMSIIPQKDYLIENLTVRENLLYSSQLLNWQEDFDHERNIMRVVKMLNLNHCINSQAANISGGEYKRVSIAQELLRQPDILILDEPTSGLDSLSCKKLIQTLRHLIDNSKRGTLKPLAVVMTIHQPDIDIYNMFDHVYCMARGGRVIFDGHPSETLQTLRSHAGFQYGTGCGGCGGGGGGVGGDDQFSHQILSSPPELNPNNDGQQALAVNPANLLIEIASEDLYGSEPVDRLAKYQRKQFEQSYNEILASCLNTNDTYLTSNTGIPVNRTTKQAKHQQSITFSWSPSSLDANNLQANIVLASYTDNHDNVIKLGHDSNRSSFSIPSSSSSSSASSSSSSLSTATTISMPTPPDDKQQTKNLKRDKRLTAKHNHQGKFWYHTSLLTRRAFVSTVRDPMMTMISLVFHLCLPFVMWVVYPRRVGRINACPVIQRDLDLVSMASNRTLEKMGELQGDMIATFECSTMLFITIYALSMCSMTVAGLAFPLTMHILLKEVRNGWYDLKTFVLAKQFASIPFEIVFPSVTMILIYVMLDMPSSNYEWRLWSMAAVMAAISMIGNTQGLLIGTVCMDSVQTAVFLSIASTLPQIMLSGFTARIKWMPAIFRHLSWTSPYRYASELINTIRFGFGICPCNDDTNEYLRNQKPTFTDIPENLKSMLVYYLSIGNGSGDQAALATGTNATVSSNATEIGTSSLAANNMTVTSLVTSNNNSLSASNNIAGISHTLLLNSTERSDLLNRMDKGEVDIFESMAEMMTRSLSFGRQITDCKSVRSQLLEAMNAEPEDLFYTIVGWMIGLLLFYKIALFLVVKFKVGSRV